MPALRTLSLPPVFLLSGAASAPLLAQSTGCELGWAPSFQDLPFAPATSPLELDLPTGQAFAEFDDGSGKALYLAGTVSVNGSAETQILRYSRNGSTVVGSGFPGVVTDMCAFDDGTGARLYVAFREDDAFTVPDPLLRWDGVGWEPVPLPSQVIDEVFALETYDDGTGLKLYAGYDDSLLFFSDFGCVAAYDGQDWSPLDEGLAGTVFELEVFDDGTQETLVVGGSFSQVLNYPIQLRDVASFDGTSWMAFGAGFDGAVQALEVHDDGQGPALFAGVPDFELGTQTTVYLHRWNGADWSPILGLNQTVQSLISIPPGSELPEGLVVASINQDFSDPEQACAGLGRWDGSQWHPVGTGIPGAFVNDLALYDDGQSAAFFAAFVGGGVDSGDRGFGRFACDADPRYASIAGCSGLKPGLLPLTGSLDLGTNTQLVLFGNFGGAASTWLYYLGADGSDPLGCGLDLPGLGELLLDAASPIEFLGVGLGNPAFSIQPSLQVSIPADATLAGKSIAVQAIGPNVGGAGLVRFSRSLVATLEFAP